jgi:ankyrin repeat protein
MNQTIKFLYLSALLTGNASFAMDSDDQSLQLRKAVIADDLAQVKRLLAAGVPADGISWICARNNPKIHKLLFDATVPDERGRMLWISANSGCLAEVRELLDAGVPVDSKDKDGCTALTNAAMNGHIEVCQLLIDRNAQLDAKDNHGDIPLVRVSFGWSVFFEKTCYLLLDAMLKPIEQKQSAVIALLGMKKFGKVACLKDLDRHIIQSIARDMYEPVMQEKQKLFAQINAMADHYLYQKDMKRELLEYAQKQLAPKSNSGCIIL